MGSLPPGGVSLNAIESPVGVVAAAAIVFVAAAVAAASFQLALALGAPWGSYAMGGRFPGRFTAPLRVAALAQAALLGLLAAVILARAGLALESWAPVASWLVWVVVALSGVSLVLNSITPSRGERRIWAPVAMAMFASSLVVALSG